MSEANKPCTVLNIFAFLSKRWTLLIIKSLAEWADTFSDISRSLPWISSRILSERLKELETEGFMSRDVISLQPIKIRYSLTEKWHSFGTCMESLATWQEQWWTK